MGTVLRYSVFLLEVLILIGTILVTVGTVAALIANAVMEPGDGCITTGLVLGIALALLYLFIAGPTTLFTLILGLILWMDSADLSANERDWGFRIATAGLSPALLAGAIYCYATLIA